MKTSWQTRLIRIEQAKFHSRLNMVSLWGVFVLLVLQVMFVVKVETGGMTPIDSAKMIYDFAGRYIDNISFAFIPALLLVNVAKEFEYAAVNRFLVSGLSRNQYFLMKLFNLAIFSIMGEMMAVFIYRIAEVYHGLPAFKNLEKLMVHVPVACCLGSLGLYLAIRLKRSLYALAVFVVYILVENMITTILPVKELNLYFPFHTCVQLLRNEVYESGNWAWLIVHTYVFLYAAWLKLMKSDLG